MKTKLTPAKGEQCEATAMSTGERCRARAFALVRVERDGRDGAGERWLCGNHQRRAKLSGTVVLVRKWEAS